MRKCKFCGKEFPDDLDHHFVTGHVGNCKANPDLLARHQKIQKTLLDKGKLLREIFTQTCPKCGKEFTHELLKSSIKRGKYPKFCSKKCSHHRVLSAETKEKLRKASTGKTHPEFQKREIRQCVVCHSEFVCLPCHKRSTCLNSECVRINQSRLAVQRVKDGRVHSHSHRVKFLFQNEEIRCDSLMEYACLDWCVKNYQTQQLSRSSLVIEYVYSGKIHNYIPDFEMITQSGEKFIIECKTAQVGKVLSQKWDNYLQKSPLKENALRNFCQKNDIKMIWFDANKQHRSFYRKLQQNLKEHRQLPSDFYLLS